MRRGRVALAVLAACAVLGAATRGVRAQDPAEVLLASEPMLEVGADVCPPPPPGLFMSPTDSRRSCRVRHTASAGGVTAEIVAHGDPDDVVSIHLAIRRGEEVWARRHIGMSGVGCGGSGPFATSFALEELTVRDVLGGPAPEVLVRVGPPVGAPSGGDQLFVCTTDVTPPRCAELRPERSARVRYRRPDLALSDGLRARLDA